MGNLENRLTRLEERAGMSGAIEPLCWLIECVGAKDGKPIPPGELLGVKTRDETIFRSASESEEAFLARTEAEELEKVKDQRHPVVCMTAIRSKEASQNAKP